MGEKREDSYSVNGIKKFMSIEQMENWIWDKRSYDFFLENGIRGLGASKDGFKRINRYRRLQYLPMNIWICNICRAENHTVRISCRTCNCLRIQALDV